MNTTFVVYVYSYELRSEWREEFTTMKAAKEYAACYEGNEFSVFILDECQQICGEWAVEIEVVVDL